VPVAIAVDIAAPLRHAGWPAIAIQDVEQLVLRVGRDRGGNRDT
jgi:hypothetical protein